MSLFDNPDESSPLPKSALFDDETTSARKSASNLFDGSTGDSNSLPWSLPTPKKGSRGELLKTLLPSSDVPEIYIEVFDGLLSSGYRARNGTTVAGIKQLMADAKISASDKKKIEDIVFPGGQERDGGIVRGEFNVAMALIGLAQEGEDLSLDVVDERRRNLPVPKLEGSHKESSGPKETSVAENPSPDSKRISNTPKSKLSQQNTYSSFPESDPWGSPELHKGHNHSQKDSNTPQVGESTKGSDSGTGQNRGVSSSQPAKHVDQNSWGSRHAPSTDPFRDSGIEDTDYNAEPGHNNAADFGSSGRSSRNIGGSGGGGRDLNQANEIITITPMPDKEGVFLFQHRNYEVTSVKRNSTVIRRYSDFVWLLDCLHKRYPFRQLPLLPPKRVAINGNHIAADTQFLEKRRKGLARFANTLVRHPVLSQEQLVVMFFTVPTELAVWRKQATVLVQEEFSGKPLPSDLEESLPANIQETFDTVRFGVKRSAEIYINLCTLLERLTRRNEGVAADHMRISVGLRNLAEASKDTYAIDANDVPLLNVGIQATAKHMSENQNLLEEEAKAWEEGVIEDTKRQRDCLVSMRDMFDRRDRLDKNNIAQLEKRIAANESKLIAIRSKPEVKAGETEKVEEVIQKDKQSIVDQHARGVFVKECIRDEITFFQQTQYHVSRLHQNWSQERVKYTELQVDNWKALRDEVEPMPLGD